MRCGGLVSHNRNDRCDRYNYMETKLKMALVIVNNNSLTSNHSFESFHVVYYGKSQKIEKIKIWKIYLFLMPSLPSQNGRIVAIPYPQTFFTAKLFDFFFTDTWVSGSILAKKQNRLKGKSERGDCDNYSSLLKDRERDNIALLTTTFNSFSGESVCE